MKLTILNTLSLFAREKSPEVRNYRICASVVYRHRDVVSLGFPRKKTHPIQAKFGKNKEAIYIHAEVEALLRAMRVTKLNAKDYSIYIARVKRPGAFSTDFIEGDARPCKGCGSFIHFCGLSQVIHT
jgi:hypothetical protein